MGLESRSPRYATAHDVSDISLLFVCVCWHQGQQPRQHRPHRWGTELPHSCPGSLFTRCRSGHFLRVGPMFDGSPDRLWLDWPRDRQTTTSILRPLSLGQARQSGLSQLHPLFVSEKKLQTSPGADRVIGNGGLTRQVCLEEFCFRLVYTHPQVMATLEKIV